MGNFDYIVEGIEEVERHCQLFTDIRGIVNEELGIHYGVSKLAYELKQYQNNILLIFQAFRTELENSLSKHLVKLLQLNLDIVILKTKHITKTS